MSHKPTNKKSSRSARTQSGITKGDLEYLLRQLTYCYVGLCETAELMIRRLTGPDFPRMHCPQIGRRSAEEVLRDIKQRVHASSISQKRKRILGHAIKLGIAAWRKTDRVMRLHPSLQERREGVLQLTDALADLVFAAECFDNTTAWYDGLSMAIRFPQSLSRAVSKRN